jgi:hypothetical protein
MHNWQVVELASVSRCRKIWVNGVVGMQGFLIRGGGGADGIAWRAWGGVQVGAWRALAALRSRCWGAVGVAGGGRRGFLCQHLWWGERVAGTAGNREVELGGGSFLRPSIACGVSKW